MGGRYEVDVETSEGSDAVLGGRSSPGPGRTSKLYLPAAQDIAASLASAEPVLAALHRLARDRCCVVLAPADSGPAEGGR